MITIRNKIPIFFAFFFLSVFPMTYGWKLNADIISGTVLGQGVIEIAISMVEEAGKKVTEAENEVAMRVKAEESLKEAIAAKKKQISTAQGDTEALEKELKVLEEKLKCAEAARIEAGQKLVEAYENLAVVYKAAGLVGDPVLIGTGEYSYSAEDFIAQDYLEIFKVSRNLRRETYSESFGKYWTCSLDSRIIRGRETDTESRKTDLLNRKQELEAFNSMNETLAKDYSGSYSQENKQLFEEGMVQVQEELEKLEVLNQHNIQIDELNKFAAYGYYSDKEKYIVGDNVIIFIDEDGRNILCEFEDNKWIPINKKLAANLYVLNEGEGFEVIYRNGFRKHFDKYGILYKTCNRAGEEVIFISENGRIKEVHNKTGEIIHIKRNGNNEITSISGKTSGTAEYTYSNGALITCSSNSGTKESYKYDKNGYLTQILLGDEEAIRIEYEYYKKQKKTVVSAVINQLGQKETFSYDFGKKLVTHKTISGNIETYYLDDEGATKAYENESGISRKFQFDENNQISGVFENNEWKYFTYDEYFQPIKVSFEDGVSTFTEYNEFGEISFQSDKDGFTNESIFDEKGNIIVTKFCDEIISEMEYYPNGLVKQIKECNGIYIFEYNDFGSVTKKTKTSSSGDVTVEEWTYDSMNRKIKYENGKDYSVYYSYGDNCITEVYPGKKIVHFFDSYQRETETVETDLITGISYCKKIVYDKGGNPLEVYLDGKKFIEYEYEIPGKVTAYIVHSLSDDEKSLKRKFLFDSKKRILGEEVSFVEDGKDLETEKLYSISYEDNSDGMVMKVKRGNLAEHKYIYNNKNQLIQILRPNGLTEKRTYTKSGKLDSIISDKERIDFHYYNDGKVSVTKTNDNQTQAVSIYNTNSQLIYETDYSGNTWSRIYDSDGLLIKEIGPDFYTLYEYDEQGFKSSEKLYSFSGKLCYQCDYQYDFENRKISRIEGEKYISSIYYDAWGRIIKTENEKGCQNYKYDILGNCVKLLNEDGTEKLMTYTSQGNVSETYINGNLFDKISYTPSGKIKEFKEFGKTSEKWIYDTSGNLITKYDALNNQTNYNFDNIGNVVSETTIENIQLDFIYTPEEKKVSLKNASGNFYSNKFDENNNLIWEQDSFGNIAEYKFDDKNRIISKKDFENKNTTYYYDDVNNITVESFSNGENCIIEKDPLGHIVRLENNEGSILFDYDTGGKLIEMKDNISGIQVFYDYDSYGRCIEKSSSNFDLCIEYDNTGLISCVSEKSDSSSISVEYDVYGRETRRDLSNGVSIHSVYNSKGQKDLVFAKEPYGLVISAEATLYDENGKKHIVANKDGDITRYCYDNKGRLESVEYPYSEEIVNKARREAIECGIYLKDENPDGAVCSIGFEDYEGVNSLLQKAGQNTKANKTQKCWKEVFTYTKNGNVASVENSFGKILYEYDSENRLIQKHGVQTEAGGIKFKWDRNGNLVQYVSSLAHMDFNYGNYNRPEYIKFEDYETGEVKEAFYTYDALGRRVSEQIIGEENHRFIYDGISSSLLIDTPVFVNNISVMKFSTEEPLDNERTENREIDLSNYSEFNEYRTSDENNRIAENQNEENTIKFESRPCTSIVINGIPSAYLYIDSSYTSGRSTEFLLMNTSNTSITGVIDKYGNCMGLNNYDVWGLPLPETEMTSKNSSYSNSKNMLRINGNILDLGNRDYIPSMKSFISKDPAKDRYNWFAYCSTDPVNYYDLSGLEKESLSPYEQAMYNAGIASLLNFKESEYKATGTSAGIHHTYDCADTSGAADTVANKAANLSSQSDRGQKFAQADSEGKYNEAKESINSWNFFDEKTSPEDSFRKTSNGYSRYDKTNTKARNKTYENLADPSIVSPGTVFVWSNPDKIAGGTWIGHTLTVVSREFDSNGNVIGIVYIEGHTGGDKTSLGYMSLNKKWQSGVFNLDAWYGVFEGTFEIERSTAACGK